VEQAVAEECLASPGVVVPGRAGPEIPVARQVCIPDPVAGRSFPGVASCSAAIETPAAQECSPESV
jgi:hypothetical protein